ncbi:MAG: GNAT family N-acetyltransferase [Planctomycetota bacterium]|jgi:RimJ/RimL family protein N-acetyltransferase
MMAVIEPRQITLKNGKNVCIRTQVVEDIERSLAYLKAIFADDRFFLTTGEEAEEWQVPEKQQERIETYYQDEKKLLVVTIVDNKIVSMSHVECDPKKRTQHVADLGISILTEYRGIGLGTEIMEVMIRWAIAHSIIEKLTLSVWAANKRAITSVKIYRRFL